MADGQESDGEQRQGDEELVWDFDPTDRALSASYQRYASVEALSGSDQLPEPLCSEIGRRLLLAAVQFNRWVVRRVEKISFEMDRNVTRRLTIDLNVREDAPLVTDKVGDRYWIVPISLMRRRTLVNMLITDQFDHVLPTPGLRLTQQLDESILLAAILSVDPELAKHADVGAFIRDLVAGDRELVQAAMKKFQDADGSSALGRLAKSPIVRAVVHLLQRNFVLYVMLPAGIAGITRTRHRLINLEFSEPTAWTRMRPKIRDEKGKPGLKDTEAVSYAHDDRPLRAAGLGPNAGWLLHHGYDKVVFGLPAALGLRSTRIRVQVPGAENASSYHLELTAPAGVEVIDARLLAGRPNESSRRYTHDRVLGHTATVGLHGVEIPNGSLCQAQFDFRVSSHGWLTSAAFGCGLLAFVLWSLQIPAQQHVWPAGQVTNIIALLITTAAAVGALIAHSSFTGVAARMVARMRGLAALAVAQPLVVAGALAYAREEGNSSAIRIDDTTLTVLSVSTAITTGIFLVIGLALALSLRAEWRGYKQASPWDMTADDDRHKFVPVSYAHDFNKAKFYRSSIAVLSAEGWHERYEWTNDKQSETVQALEALVRTPPAGMSEDGLENTVCRAGDACPYHYRSPSVIKTSGTQKETLVQRLRRRH
jgi:hypothetical protein